MAKQPKLTTDDWIKLSFIAMMVLIVAGVMLGLVVMRFIK